MMKKFTLALLSVTLMANSFHPLIQAEEETDDEVEEVIEASETVEDGEIVEEADDEDEAGESEEASQTDDNLSKTPNLILDVNFKEYKDFEMPADYPAEIADIPMDTPRYIVMDQESQKVLAAKDATKPYAIASLSKIVSVYMVYKAIDEGKVKLTDKVEIPAIIAEEISTNEELSNVGLVAGEKYSVEDLLHAIMIVSANDATTALLSHVYGSEQEAVKAIRAQLNEWGFTDSQFYTTSGAPNYYLPESMRLEDSIPDNQNYMSAANLALMTKYVIEAYPQILDITSKDHYDFMSGTDYAMELHNSNELLPGRSFGRDGVTGLKSGYTDTAGKCFITTSTENGRPTITVVMGITEPHNSYEETATLLNGLNQHEELIDLDLPINEVTVEEEAEEEVEEEAAEEAPVEDRRHNDLSNFIRKITSIFK